MRTTQRLSAPMAALASLVTLASLTACDAAALLPLAPRPPSVAQAPNSVAPVERPWSGECRFAAERLSPTLIRITGECELAHLGRATFINLQTLVPGPVTQFTNATTYTAANGDQLHTTATGTATPAADFSRRTLAATETPVGGTGRFERASGEAALTGTTFLTGPAAGTGFYELSGTLTFAASDRAR